MILGPSGQNIYPEEIEDRLNNMLYVAESLIISQGGKLVRPHLSRLGASR